MLDASGTQHLLLAETLGLAMARRATDILDRHRAALMGAVGAGGTANQDNDDQFAFDNAIFTAVLDAANECLGRFDTRPADERCQGDPVRWRTRFFLKLIPADRRNRQRVSHDTLMPRSCSSPSSACRVRSGFSANRASSHVRSPSSLLTPGRPPIGRGAGLPVERARCAHFTTLATLTRNSPAT